MPTFIKKLVLVFFSSCLTLSLIYGQIGNTPWPMRGHDVRHTGQSTYNGPNTANLRWEYSIMADVISCISIGSDNTIYVGTWTWGFGGQGSLFALNSDGSLKWEFYTGGSGDSSPVINSDGTIYIGSDDDHLYAIKPDGIMKWKFKTGDNINSSPAIGSDGTIYVGSNDDHLYAIKPDGIMKWKFKTGDNINSSPAIGSDGTIYVGSNDDYLYAINTDGSMKWKFKTQDDVELSPAISANGIVYVVSNDRNLYALNPDGSMNWKFYVTDGVNASPSVGLNGTIYLGVSNDLYAITPQGTLKWKNIIGNFDISEAALGSDGTIYIGTDDYKVYSLYPDGSIKWKFNTNHYMRTSPSIGSDGSLYIGSDIGKIYAFGKQSTNVRPLLSSGKVLPEKGTENTEFLFSVIYTDTDNDPPLKISLKIDKNDLEIMPKIITGNDFTKGVVYEYRTRLSSGSHTFSFSANDGVADATGDTATHIGLTVTKNNVPVLSEGSVLPKSAYEKITFVFRVTYTDTNNDPPHNIAIRVDNDTLHVMTPIHPNDTDYTKGWIYEYRTKLSIGNHSYAFLANDGLNDAIGDTGRHQGPTVTNIPPSGPIIHVPADYPYIQQAIDVASFGDVVLVAPGVYYEHIDFGGKAIVVKSTLGYDTTTIDGYQSGTVVKFVSTENVKGAVLDGFKITNGSAAGILITSSPTIKNNWITKNAGSGIAATPLLDVITPTITGNIIENNTANTGGGISVGSSTRGPTIPTISHNIIRGNTASFRGGGIALANTWSSYSNYPTIFNNLIVKNSSGIYIANSLTAPSADVSIGNNTIAENSGPGIYAIMGAPNISDCIIWDNVDDLKFTSVSTSTQVRYSDIKDGDYSGTNGNISIDPLFMTGPLGQYYLSQTGARQAQQSPCVNSGSLSSSSKGLRGMTTRTDGVSDEGQVDMGYHFSVSTSTSVGVKVSLGIPETFELSQNYPNPFNSNTTISFALIRTANVSLKVINILDQEIQLLVNERMEAGKYQVMWDASTVPSGIYFYRLRAGEFIETKKMILVK